MGGPLAWGLGEVLTTPPCSKTHVENYSQDEAGTCEYSKELSGSIKMQGFS
jgi:hypothetical protein